MRAVDFMLIFSSAIRDSRTRLTLQPLSRRLDDAHTRSRGLEPRAGKDMRDPSTSLGMTKSDALRPRRQLGLFDATMIVMGGIVGAGIFANPSEVAHRVHTPFLILGVWVVGGLIAMCGAFIWAELATRLPAAEGGQYVYLREAYHPALAFMYGWGLLLITQTGGMAAVAVIFASYFRTLTGADWNNSAMAAIALLTLTA